MGFGFTEGKKRHQRPWVARDQSFKGSILCIKESSSSQKFKELGALIDHDFEYIETPN